MCSFIVKEMMVEKPEVLKVISEMAILERRTDLSLEDINKSIGAIAKDVNNLKAQIAIPPLNDHDYFVSQITPFYNKANEDLQKLREYYKASVDCYNSLVKQFGENPASLKSTEFFSYIVSFITSIKASHKHYLDVQAEEKLKKVAQDWQAGRGNPKAKPQPESEPDVRPTSQPPSIQSLPPPPARKAPPPLPPVKPVKPVVQRSSTEQTSRGEIRQSMWERLKSWRSKN